MALCPARPTVSTTARARGDVYGRSLLQARVRSLARSLARARVRERPSTYVGEAASIVSSRKSRLHAGDDSLHSQGPRAKSWA